MDLSAAHDFWEHDNRHTLVTELCESGAGDQTIMSIAGHVSRAMLSRGTSTCGKRRSGALDEIATPWVQPTRSARRKPNSTHYRSMRRWRSSRFAGNRWRAGKPIWIRRCSDGLLAHLGAVTGSVSGNRDTD